jgi:hypothetical protein
MFYMQNKLIESIQQDRQREAAAERLNASMRPPRSSRRHLFVLPLTVTDTVKGTRSTIPRRAV